MTQAEHYITLNNGAKMPSVGLGTWKSQPDEARQAVEYALGEGGYRHIDCAAVYGNEAEIGQAFGRVFSSGKVKRDEVFITSKLWCTAHAKGDVEAACRKTLQDLQLEYLDLYLMHWGIAVQNVVGGQVNQRDEPLDGSGVLLTANVSIRETWQAMENLVKKGLVRAIGVSNFTGALLVDLLSWAHTFPAVNQIELHPYNQQSRLVDFCHYRGIGVTAYSPLGSPGNMKDREGQPSLLKDSKVIEIARAHKKSAAQVLIRWAIERGTAVIPKSVTAARIKNNLEVFDFELSKEEVAILGTLEKKHRFVDPWEWWKIPYFE